MQDSTGGSTSQENDVETYQHEGKEHRLPELQKEVTLNGTGFQCQVKGGHSCLNGTSPWHSGRVYTMDCYT